MLALGDVVGAIGCQCVRNRLPTIKKDYAIDIVVANGENAAEGNGILPASAQHLWDSGVDIITTGNHALRRKEIYELFDSGAPLVRPVNFHPEAPGVGVHLYDKPGCSLCVINLQGVVFMDNLENPFTGIDHILAGITAKHILVDFHCEATSEKLAMGFYLDGRVSAMVGTHTHVQTADERIFPGGMGYITDLGMCGCFQSVLGVKPDQAIRRLVTHLPQRFENEKGLCKIMGVVIEIEDISGKCTKIERINLD